MNLWLLVTYLSFFAAITCNYFFDNSKVNGLTKQQWLKKCKNILHDTQLHQVIFNIKDLCTQLRCMRDNNEVYMGFDYCMRSSVRCKYPEPDTTLPFPECCPQCYDSNDWMSFKEFMENKNKSGHAARIRKGNQDLLVI